MKKYFYIENEEQYGPFTFDELKDHNIEKSTPIWYEAITDWTEAGELPELSGLFEILELPVKESDKQLENEVLEKYVPPSQHKEPIKQRGFPPKTWLVESILVTLFCCLPFGIAGIVFSSKVESLFYAGDIEGAERASREAGKWTKIGFWIAGGILILYLVIFLIKMLFMAGSLMTLFNN